MIYLLNLIKRVSEAVTVFLFATVLTLQALNVLFRYTGGEILPTMMWVEEFTTFSFIWIFFLLWHIADKRGDHFVVDVLSNKLSGRFRKGPEILGHLVALFFAGLVVWGSIRFIPVTMYPTNSFRWLPMAAIYLIIPAGLSLVIIERASMLWRCLKEVPVSKEEGDFE